MLLYHGVCEIGRAPIASGIPTPTQCLVLSEGRLGSKIKQSTKLADRRPSETRTGARRVRKSRFGSPSGNPHGFMPWGAV